MLVGYHLEYVDGICSNYCVLTSRNFRTYVRARKTLMHALTHPDSSRFRWIPSCRRSKLLQQAFHGARTNSSFGMADGLIYQPIRHISLIFTPNVCTRLAKAHVLRHSSQNNFYCMSLCPWLNGRTMKCGLIKPKRFVFSIVQCRHILTKKSIPLGTIQHVFTTRVTLSTFCGKD